MLGTLLDRLSAFFSRAFLVNCIPLLFFLFLHGLTAYFASATFQSWVRARLLVELDHPALLSFALILAVSIVAYVLSTLNLFLRELLEGKYFGSWISESLSQRYRDRLTEVEGELKNARRNLHRLRTNADSWAEQMGTAMRAGYSAVACTYTRRAGLQNLLDRRAANQDITVDQLEPEVNALIQVLRSNSAMLIGNDASDRLDADHGALLELIQYASERLEAKVVRYFNEVQFDFAGTEVAATKMGILAGTAAYYAKSRYALNLEFFWSRIQKTVQVDTVFYAELQDAKSQLDFLVSLFWQTLLYTLIWLVILPLARASLWSYLLIVCAGPALTWTWYVIAVRNYRAFSDLMRAAIDLHRIDLLKALNMPLPASMEEERVLWLALEQRLGYGDKSNVPLKGGV